MTVPYELTPEPEPVALPPAAPASVDEDIPCRRCGYNLRGLPIASRCPECGVPLNVSVNGDLLRYSDPEFVGTLHRGVRLMLWGILVSVIGAILAVVVTATSRSAVSSLGVQLLPLAGSVLNIIGAWLLTTPDPSGIGEDLYGMARRLIRIALIADVLNHVISLGNQVPVPPAASIVLQVVTALCGLAGLIGMFAQLVYLEKLASRIPDQALSDRSRQIKWGFTIPYAVILAFGLLAVLLGRGASGGSGVAITAGCIAGLAGIVAIVYAIMYLFLQINFSRALAAQTALARANWTPAE